ncbi:MAG: HD domain-containing protein [Firmicutes bacterium]|nr:HD domain-containing protein [Bacillota bacterium]MBR6700913.1 HD domain-containing protein [Bacillota bacterium]
MKDERLKKQMEFALEIDKEKNIFRQTHLSGKGRRENDAEHAWHMAMMIYLLKEYANEEIDIAKAMMMALLHDVVEIDAGDTYAYDTEGLKLQKEKEAKAAERIFGLLPDDQRDEMKALFEEFEAHESPEARFVRVIDNLQPLMLNDSNRGGDWIEHKVTKSQIYKRNQKTGSGSEKLWEYIQELIQRNIDRGSIRDE